MNAPGRCNLRWADASELEQLRSAAHPGGEAAAADAPAGAPPRHSSSSSSARGPTTTSRCSPVHGAPEELGGLIAGA